MPSRRVLVVGATGTIGRATVRALLRQGHEVTCLVRPHREFSIGPGTGVAPDESVGDAVLSGARVLAGQVTDRSSLTRAAFSGEPFDAVISCLASRTGAPRDAWTVDHQANLNVLHAAREAGARHFVLLSAICVQKPRLAFQHAKLAFEQALMGSGITWTIVRPTAYFKSLSGQLQRVRQGKPFLVFGDGALTRCKPIGDDDLGDFLAQCVADPERHDRILPIGGPGRAITPREQGELLFEAVGRAPRFRHVPVGMLRATAATLGLMGRLAPPLAEKAELARIGHYYATESMLVWDASAGRYDADATPAFGRQTLADHYARLVRGDVADDRGAHAVY